MRQRFCLLPISYAISPGNSGNNFRIIIQCDQALLKKESTCAQVKCSARSSPLAEPHRNRISEDPRTKRDLAIGADVPFIVYQKARTFGEILLSRRSMYAKANKSVSRPRMACCSLVSNISHFSPNITKGTIFQRKNLKLNCWIV